MGLWHREVCYIMLFEVSFEELNLDMNCIIFSLKLFRCIFIFEFNKMGKLIILPCFPPSPLLSWVIESVIKKNLRPPPPPFLLYLNMIVLFLEGWGKVHFSPGFIYY